jgi:hypothetical protein
VDQLYESRAKAGSIREQDEATVVDLILQLASLAQHRRHRNTSGIEVPPPHGRSASGTGTGWFFLNIRCANSMGT